MGQLVILVYLLVVAPVTGVWSLTTGILGVLALITLFLVTYRPQVVRPGIWTLAALAFVTGAVLLPERTKSIAFYQATAQVVPILFVVLAVELGAFRPGHRLRADRRAATVTAAALLFAGWESLRALAENSVTAADFRLVAAAMAAAAVALFGLTVTTPSQKPKTAQRAVPAARSLPRPYDLVVGLLLLWVAGRRRR